MDASAVHGMVFNVGEMGSGNTCNETDMVQCSGDVISFLVQQRLGRKPRDVWKRSVGAKKRTL